MLYLAHPHGTPAEVASHSHDPVAAVLAALMVLLVAGALLVLRRVRRTP